MRSRAERVGGNRHLVGADLDAQSRPARHQTQSKRGSRHERDAPPLYDVPLGRAPRRQIFDRHMDQIYNPVN